MPEWDDAVDAGYDFEHDELSVLNRDERDLAYIWDIFEKETTPIDGVLISREQIESTANKAERIKQHGVHDDPILSIPEWLPTISDCGAWGYKSLPFPPYGNEEMLEFYGELDVDVGVTIDHLVLGSGEEKGRLYLDERAFDGEFRRSDIPSELTDAVDLMIDEWDRDWPSYVGEYTDILGKDDDVEPFRATDFDGTVDEVLDRLKTDPRAVYRQNDKRFRYELTLENARKARSLYEQGDYEFRLMVAVQGWDSSSYTAATEQVLTHGYDYVGIGGVAGSPVHEVRKTVKSVGKTAKGYEREHTTRVDTHVFGFAKSEAFETIGRSGMASFDSASMLRSAWTGGENYRLDSDERYDAIRVRYPKSGSEIADAIETALRGRETLEALRAYAGDESITDALTEWCEVAETTLEQTRKYLQSNRHDERYDATRLRDLESRLRDDFDYARKLQAYFSDDLRSRFIKLLREDSADDPLPFEEYESLLQTAEVTFEQFPRMPAEIETWQSKTGGLSSFEQVWLVVEDYATWVGDEDLLEAYRKTLSDKPWERCDCPICSEHGVEVCIFRGNDRNRRRGFHNTDRFYDEFSDALPKTLIITDGGESLSDYDTVESYLETEAGDFWREVHDLPVAEIGVVDDTNILEWWADTQTTDSPDSQNTGEALTETLSRYDRLYVYGSEIPSTTTEDALEDAVDDLRIHDQGQQLRADVLNDLGESYSVGADFLPHSPEFSTDDKLNILVVDQCSGSKYTPDGMSVLEADEIDGHSREELLRSENIRGIPAHDLYTGRQQEYVSEAIRQLRADGHSVQRYFISAGFGVVEESEPLPPYEVTFSGMKVGEIRERSARLGIKRDITRVLQEDEYDVVFFALGSDYYKSIDIDQTVQLIQPDTIGVVFNRDLVGDQFDNIVSVSARTEDAKRHGTIVIGLKGLYLKHFAQNLSQADTIDPDIIETLCRYVDDESVQAAIKQF